MSTPRRTRVWRAPDLAGVRDHLAALVEGLDPIAASNTFIWVPTRGAGEQLRRTIEDRLLPDGTGVIALPHIGTRADLYDVLADRLVDPAPALSGFERDVMLAAAARDAEDAGLRPPFHVRPALIAEMLALYDHVRRLGRSAADFERLMTGELEPAADTDRGAAQLLDQTRFLSAAFAGYEARLAESRGADEHRLRAHAQAEASMRPLRHVVVTVGDRTADPDGFWPADAALLTTCPGLESLDLVATNAVLAAGLLDRIRLTFLEIEEASGGISRPRPRLVVPPAAAERPLAWTYRDRESELEDLARRVKAEDRDGRRRHLHRTALVVARPLPYLYIAREVFGSAGIPFETTDTLPLAAEPYAAAVDLALDFVASDFTRRSTVALLKSPHFLFGVDGAGLAPRAVVALDAALADARFLGGRQRLSSLAAEWAALETGARSGDRRRRSAAGAAAAALAAATDLEPLLDRRPLVDQLTLLQTFLTRHHRPEPDDAPDIGRRRRVRGAIDASLMGLAAAYTRHDPAAEGSVHELWPLVRRWLGAQTFAARAGDAGLQMVDPQAARFGDFDDVQLMGLVDGEWPAPAPRSMFFPRALLAQLEPERPTKVDLDSERDQLRAARAAFRDLAGLASSETRLSTFALESDAVVEPSVLLEDVEALGLDMHAATPEPDTRILADEALGLSPPVVGHLPPDVARWARVRWAGAARDAARFTGEAGPWRMPRVSVSRVERYAKCPFQFYASNVLGLDEAPEDQDARSPLERGRFLHEVFEAFFREWHRLGHRRIAPDVIDDARRVFAEVAEAALSTLSPSEAALERARLLGSLAGSGMGERVFSMEAERAVEVRERLLEYSVDGAFTFTASDGSERSVTLSAKVDRVDVLSDGRFRLIDYKTKYVPELSWALQLPIYSACVRTRLSQAAGRDVAPAEAMYLSLEGDRGVVALKPRRDSLDEVIAGAEQRLIAALDGIAAGHFPPRPATKSLCTFCAFRAVCRTPGGLPNARPAADEAPTAAVTDDE